MPEVNQSLSKEIFVGKKSVKRLDGAIKIKEKEREKKRQHFKSVEAIMSSKFGTRCFHGTGLFFKVSNFHV